VRGYNALLPLFIATVRSDELRRTALRQDRFGTRHFNSQVLRYIPTIRSGTRVADRVTGISITVRHCRCDLGPDRVAWSRGPGRAVQIRWRPPGQAGGRARARSRHSCPRLARATSTSRLAPRTCPSPRDTLLPLHGPVRDSVTRSGETGPCCLLSARPRFI